MSDDRRQPYTNLVVGPKSLLIGRNVFDISTPEGRMAVRAFAWTLAAEGEQSTKEKLLAVVGRDDG